MAASRIEAPFVDTHCHLDFLFKKLQHRGSLAEFRRANYATWSPRFEGCIADWCEPKALLNRQPSARQLVQAAAGNTRSPLINMRAVNGPQEESVVGAFGCHPHFAEAYSESLHEAIKRRMAHTKCVAIGECCLDFSEKNNNAFETQKFALEQQLKLGQEFVKPVVVHCRGSSGSQHGRGDAEKLCLDLIKQHLPKYHGIHRHCFTLGMEAARPWLEEFPSLYLGLTPLIVAPRGRSAVMEVVKEAPLDRLLIETDAPYFLPQKYGKSLRHGHPGIGWEVAQTIADARNIPIETVFEQIRNNTRKLYGV